MQRLLTSCFALMALLCSHLIHADQALTQRKDVKNFINLMVKKHHFKRQELTQLLNEVVIQPQIIESMTKPFEKKTWDIYKQLFLTPQRVEAGLAFWKANQAALAKAEKQYNVPAQVIVAILGVETLYGKHQGTYRVIDALSTLAFTYPPRSPFFTKELEEFLLLCREHKVSPTEYMGSYAGAMGKPQFMPSSYRYYAANFSGETKKDLMNDDQAVIASVANYFHKHGWHLNQGVAQPAKVSGTQHRHIKTNNRVAAYTLDQLARAGVQPLTAAINQPKKAGLIELTTDKGAEYWLTYPNFYVITRYNTSPQYALVVYLLALQLKSQWVSASAGRKFAYS